jgi:hypothetical protein
MIDSQPTSKNRNLLIRKTMSGLIDSNDSFSWFRKADGNGVDAPVDASLNARQQISGRFNGVNPEAWLGDVLAALPMSISQTESKSCCYEKRG